MAANIEDFVTRLLRGSKKITFIFTEDFFNIDGRSGIMVDRFLNLRKVFKNARHFRGDRAEFLAGMDKNLFDVDIIVVRTNFTCFITNFQELSEGPFGSDAIILGFGNEMVDLQKAKYQVDAFLSDKLDYGYSVTKTLAHYQKRKLVLVAESHADLRRPSLEQVIALRSKKSTILISPDKGPLVDCQVAKLADSENSNSFSTFLHMFCVKY